MSTFCKLLFFSAFSIANGELFDDGICRGDCSTDTTTGKEVCKFTARINFYASELGYYEFKECGEVTNPTLGLEVGKTYEFAQDDRSNYFHPLGFAYYPDGAHDEKDELEPGVVPPGSTSTCDTDMTCPAPMYFMDGKYLGEYSNNDDILEVTQNVENFGLDDYEPKFFHPVGEWAGYGAFSVFLKFDSDTDYTKDIFYFCHIHQFMSGRIKLLRNNEPIQQGVDLPELGYEYDKPEEHDQVCGTFNTHQFQLPHDECPQKFVCDAPIENEKLLQFSQCIDSMNCAMMAGMTTSLSGAENEVALFIHQMIPHHQNAVNMAKALLKMGTLNCDDLTDEESDQASDCAMEGILRDIINGQNFQIQAMRGILESMNYPQESDCTVKVSTLSVSTKQSATEGNSASLRQMAGLSLTMIFSLVHSYIFG